jgi:hypothetical protein
MGVGRGHRLVAARKSLFALWHSEVHPLIMLFPAFSVEVA